MRCIATVTILRGCSLLLAAALVATSCGSDSGATPAPTPAAGSPDSPSPASTNNLTVSDAVPTLDELRNLGLSEPAAECFIETIDPEGTGTVQSADAFMQAWATCL